MELYAAVGGNTHILLKPEQNAKSMTLSKKGKTKVSLKTKCHENNPYIKEHAVFQGLFFFSEILEWDREVKNPEENQH